MILILIRIILYCSILNACNTASTNKDIQSKSYNNSRKIVVKILPLGKVPLDYLQFVQSNLQKDFSEVQILPKAELPKFAFVGLRKRYDAQKMLAHLQDIYKKRKFSERTFLVGVTEKDLCQNRQNAKLWKGKKGFGVPDYGIMGLGYQPKGEYSDASLKVNINSTKRLCRNTKEQLLKLIKHELGHNCGLPHCNDKQCIMRDAEGGNHFDEMNGFCKKCKLKFAVLDN